MKTPPAADSPREFASLARDGWTLGEGAVVLMYHKIGRPLPGTNFPALYVGSHRFERQLDELLAAGHPCVPFGKLAGAAPEDADGFCLTFDDGFRSVFEAALPALAARRVSAVQFLVATLIGKTDAWDHPIGEPPQALMDHGQVREWLAAGQTIGAHTLTHPRLAEIPLADARREIFDSKKLLEDRFGVAVDDFCYPYGSYNDAVRDLVGEAGYRAACTVKSGVVESGTHPLELPRVMATDLPPAWKAAAKTLRRGWRKLRGV